jgi:acyl-CoA thioesterase-1
MKSFLALGDSYTIGEGVPLIESWPHQLVKRFRDSGETFEDPQILAKTGWTTTDLIFSLTDLDTSRKYDFVSLCIGVNNQYQGIEFETYEYELRFLITSALAMTKENGQTFVLTIPDYSVTPFGASKKELIKTQLEKYNNYLAEQCERFRVPYYDVTTISQEHPDLLVSDDLHPSAEMYRLWVDKIYYLLTD